MTNEVDSEGYESGAFERMSDFEGDPDNYVQVLPKTDLQDLRTVATDFASRVQHETIYDLLTNADKVLAYLKNGTLPNDGPTDPESL